MAPRPRTVADADILKAAARAVGRVGPARLTLAEVGREVGLSPATLTQRFGTRRGLLLALVEASRDDWAAHVQASRAGREDPLDVLVEALSRGAEPLGKPDEVSNHLAFLQLDLDDPDFHGHALAQFRALRAAVQGLLDEAVEGGSLAKVDTARLARTVEVAYHGALLAWAVHREGTADEALREDVLAVLEPHRAGPVRRTLRKVR